MNIYIYIYTCMYTEYSIHVFSVHGFHLVFRFPLFYSITLHFLAAVSKNVSVFPEFVRGSTPLGCGEREELRTFTMELSTFQQVPPCGWAVFSQWSMCLDAFPPTRTRNKWIGSPPLKISIIFFSRFFCCCDIFMKRHKK